MKTTIGEIEATGWNLDFKEAKNLTFRSSSAKDDLPIKTDRTFASILSFAISLNFAATIFALLLEAVTHPSEPMSRIAGRFINTFVYSNCIGFLLCFAILSLTPRLMRFRLSLRCLLLIVMIFALGFVGVVTAGLTLMAIGIFEANDYSWFSPQRMSFDFLLAYIFSFGAYFYESNRLRLKATGERLRSTELEEERAQKLALEAGLSSLESRVRPHFLFNTLNSISALIQKDPPLAERMIERLAALLRFSLYSNLRMTVPLELELKIVGDYLEIERARFGERLRYKLDVPAELNDVAVPPFVAQTLVENSVKHSVSAQKRGGEIRVKVRDYDNQIKIEVWDDGNGFTPDEIPGGHGLDNLRLRLFAVFEQRAALEVLRENGFTIVRVSLPNHKFGVEVI